MNLQNMFDTIEETLMDILARIDDGDEEALSELKKMKKYISELNDMLSVIEESDDMESIKKKFDELSKKFDEFLLAVVKVVG